MGEEVVSVDVLKNKSFQKPQGDIHDIVVLL